MQLKADQISFSYNKKNELFHNISFHIDQGETVGLIAPSGYGKSTLAHILAGYLTPSKGKVTLDHKPLVYKGKNPIQLIMQHPEKAINPRWKMNTVLEEMDLKNIELIRELNIEQDWLNRYPVELSGGELQRFCILRALNDCTKFIIADEITTMLDTITQAQIWEILLRKTKEKNIGLLVITHDIPLAEKICSRIVSLENTERLK